MEIKNIYMSREEKILLLQLLLQDVRGNWSAPMRRVNRAKKLAEELGYFKHLTRLNSFESGNDGRWFRENYSNGGYEGLEVMHNLPFTLNDKSEEFKTEYNKYITYPTLDTI